MGAKPMINEIFDRYLRDGDWDADTIETLRREVSAALATEASGRIADTVLSWMVERDLLDAGNEYDAPDVLAVLNDLASAPAEGDTEAARRYIQDWVPDCVRTYVSMLEAQAARSEPAAEMVEYKRILDEIGFALEEAGYVNMTNGAGIRSILVELAEAQTALTASSKPGTGG
jgi:hypothetical protein